MVGNMVVLVGDAAAAGESDSRRGDGDGVGGVVGLAVVGEDGGVDGRRNLSGTIKAAKDGRLEIECDGRSYQLPIEGIAKANLVPDWEREFHRSAS